MAFPPRFLRFESRLPQNPTTCPSPFTLMLTPKLADAKDVKRRPPIMLAPDGCRCHVAFRRPGASRGVRRQTNRVNMVVRHACFGPLPIILGATLTHSWFAAAAAVGREASQCKKLLRKKPGRAMNGIPQGRRHPRPPSAGKTPARERRISTSGRPRIRATHASNNARGTRRAVLGVAFRLLFRSRNP